MFYRGIRITYHQTDRIAAICADLGIVSVASMIIPSLVDKASPMLTLMGILFALFFGGSSIYLSK